MSTPARPRHSRKEIRDFADWLDKGGWTFESVDNDGHTIWSHPRATGHYKLPETPHHFNVQRARQDVARLLGEKVRGKRHKNGKPKRQRQDFTLAQARKAPPVVLVARPAPPRRTSKRLPWEDQPDDYDRGLDRLMRTAPGGRE